MSEQENFTEENKKTVTAFAVGLIVGGLLTYVFAVPSDEVRENTADAPSTAGIEDNEDEEEAGSAAAGTVGDSNTGTSSIPAPVNVSGEGRVTVADQPAGSRVEIGSVVYPADTGWVGVRDYENGRLTGLLGVSRWSRAEGLSPRAISLQRATEAGKTYAVVFYSDNGDKVFNLATDAQLEGVIGTFTAR